MKLRNLFAVCLAVVMTLCVYAFLETNTVMAAGSWTSTQWTSTTEEGTTVFKSNPNGSMIDYNGTNDFNKIQMEVAFTQKGEETSNVAFIVTTGSNEYRISYYPEFGSIGGYNNKSNAEIAGTAHNVCPYTLNAYQKMALVFSSSCMYVYVGDVRVLEIPTITTESYDTAKFQIWCWGINAQVKNINTSMVELPKGPEWIISSAWTETEENGEAVYTHNGGYATLNRSEINDGEYNAFSFDFRVNGLTATFDANVGASILVGENSFFFEYNPASFKYVRLRYFPKDSVEGVELGRKSITVKPLNEWVNLKVVFDESYLVMYLNGEKVISYFDTKGEDMSKATASISTWNAKPSVKNLKVFKEAPDYSEAGYLDMEFSSALGVYSFDGDGLALGYQDGQLVATIKQDGATLISPEISVSQGHKYSAKLYVKNTICVRLKNDSNADSLTLSFVTADNKEYDSIRTKTFDIEPNSGYKTYFFNLSDVINCNHWKTADALMGCNHYLYGFKISFEGAESGNVYVDAITFEREDPIYEKAATEMTAIANKQEGTVTVSGKLLEKYADQNVSVIMTEITNYNELLEWQNNKLVATAKASGTNFTVTFPLYHNGNMTHLSSWFLASVSSGNNYIYGAKLGDAFQIENWEDFSENPYSFELNNLVVNATDEQFGAKGDAFTDDTKAIQKAVDYVSAQGGGTVVLPGDTSDVYGRRYIATTISMKDNVELRIEKGAILWQSQRFEEYDYGEYQPVNTHDVNIPGAPWAHAAACWNKPFIYMGSVKNVKVTGGGEVRMADPGSECLDGNRYGWDGDITLQCGAGSVIHIHPFASFNSDHIEVKNITIKRSSIWHMPNTRSSNIYFGNINMTEITCINGDGVNFSLGSYNAVVVRCSLYSNDDALVLGSVYYDPRLDKTVVPYTWQENGGVNGRVGAHDIEIYYNNLFGGHGITFIPWGSATPNEEMAEIYNIVIKDNVLGGTSTAVGAWTDNPFYGSSNFSTYDQCEADDYSPIKNVVILDNIYNSPTIFATWDGAPPEIVPVTNIISDCGIRSSNQFVNGSFDKNLRYESEADWTTGLAFWSGEGNVGTEKNGTRQATVSTTGATLTVDNYVGFVKGKGELYQGLYRSFGAYKFNCKIKLTKGTATLFVRNTLTEEIIATKEINSVSQEFVDVSVEFMLDLGMEIQVGVMQTAQDGVVYIDDANITVDTDKNVYEVDGETHEFNFDENADDFRVYAPSSNKVAVQNGQLVTDSATEYKIMLNNLGKLDVYQVSVDIFTVPGLNLDAGLYLMASNPLDATDMIDAYNVQVEAKANSDVYTIRLFKFSSTKGYLGSVADGGEHTLKDGKVSLKVVVKSNTIFVFVDDSKDYVLSYEVEEGSYGNVGLRSQRVKSVFDNFVLISDDYMEAPGDKTELNELLYWAKKFSPVGYTEATYNRLSVAISAAEALSDKAKQTEVNACVTALKNAIDGLVFVDQSEGVDLNKYALSIVISVAEEITSKGYTKDSYDALQTAIAQANTAVNTGKNVVTAKENLVLAIKALQPEKVIEQVEVPGQSKGDGCNSSASAIGLTYLALGALVGVTCIRRKRK